MKRLFSTLLRALGSVLCVSGVYALCAIAGLESTVWCVLLPAYLFVSAVILSFVPGKVGNRRREVTVIAPASSRIGGDPNPDRERPVEEVHMKGVSIPVRFPLSVVFALAVAGAVMLDQKYTSAGLLQRCITAILSAIGTVLLTRDLVNADPLFTGIRGVTVGLILFAVSAAVAYFLENALLSRVLVILVCAFLLIAGVTLNNHSMETGLSSLSGKKPPRAITRRNRIVLIVFGVVTAFVAFFDKIRAGFDFLRYWVGYGILWLIRLLMNLFPQSESTGGAGGGGMGGLEGLAADAEPAAFWVILEKVAIVVTVALCAVLLFFAVRIVWRKLRILVKKIAEHFRSFADSMGEDYHDETESLFDMDDMTASLRENVLARVKGLFTRPKAWSQMDAREKARYIVKRLYVKQGGAVDNLKSRTVREAMEQMRGVSDREEIVSLYETARYSQREPDTASLEHARKAAGV